MPVSKWEGHCSHPTLGFEGDKHDVSFAFLNAGTLAWLQSCIWRILMMVTFSLKQIPTARALWLPKH